MESQNRFYSSKLGFVGNNNAASSLRSPAHKQQQQNYFTSNYFGGGNSNRPQAGQFSSSQDRNPSTINNSSHLKTYQDGVNSRGSSYYSAVRSGDGGAGFSTPTTFQMFQHSTSSSTQHNNNYPHNSTRFSQESSLLNSNSSSLNSLIASSAGNILNNSNNSSKLKVNKKDRKKYSLFSSSSSADLLESSGGAVSANSNSSAASVDLIPENQQLLEWIDRELDLRGIDSVVYGRYILSLLHSSSESLSNSSDSGQTSSSSITVGSDVGGSITDQDSGYGPAITSNKSVFNKPNQNPPLPSWSSSAQSGTSRYCDFHQRLYPGFNLHQSRTKLLRSETKSLNTQKPSSTTKFMHKRYQNGRSGSPVSELFGAPDADECYFGGGSHNCPDCALRNNHGSVAHSTLSVKENNLTSHKPSPTLDYRKTVLRDCLRDASEQDSPNIESFVDELVSKFDSIRSQHQQPPFEISNPLRHLLSNQSESSSTATNSVKSYEATSEMDDFSVPSAGSSGTRRFIKSFPNQSFNNNNKSTNSSFVNNQNKPFNHSRSFDQSIQNNRNSSLPPAQESNASDSNSIAGSGGQWSQSQQNGPNAYRNNRTFQQSKFYRSLSDENAPKDDTISTASDSQKKGESKSTSPEDSSPSSAKPSPPTNREQALKYFTAFPALSGGFMGSSLGKTSAVSSRSASTTRPSLSSSLSSPKSSSAKMSAQSSLDDSVFGDQPNNATLSNAVDSGDGSSNKASWNGMKIIKNVIKSSGISALASLNAPEPSSSSSSSTSSMAVITTKPPTLSGKSRNLIVAAPSSLFDLSRDSSNFTTLKKKISTGSGGCNSVSALSMVRKSSSTTSSSFETEDTLSDAKQPQASNLATNSTNSAGSSTTSMVTTREQEKIFNIMPSFLNPLKSSSSGSSGSVRSSITSTTTSVTSTTMTTLSSSTNTTSSSAVKKTTSAIGPTRYQQSAPHNSTTSFAFTSTSSSFVQADARNRSGSNGRIVRPLTSNYASNSRTENQSSSLMSVNSGEYGSTTCITSSTQASQAPPPSSLTVSSSSPASSPAVDLLPSFLKKNSTLATSSCSSASSTTGNISKAPYHHSSYRNGNNNSMATTASSSTALTEEKLSNNCSYYDEDEGIVNAASTTFATTDALEDAVWRSKTNSTNVFSTGKSSSLYGSTAYQHHFYQQPFHNHQQQQQSYHRVEEDIVNRAGVLESQAPVRSQQRHHESINNSSSSHKLKTSSVSASSTVNHLTNKVRSSSDEVDHSPFGVVITSGSMATSTVTSSSSSNTYAGPATAPGNLTRTTSVDARRQLSAAAAAVTTTGTNLSNNDSSRLLNDYWFNFTNQDDAAACGDARDERDATQDDPPLVEARTNNQFELSNDKSVTNNNNKCSPDEANKDNARIDSAFVSQEEANSSGTASNQTLVIDNKEMLDQLMNSILQKQKQRRHQHQQHKQQNNSSGQAPGTNQPQQQQQQSNQPEHNFTIPTQQFSHKTSSIESRSNPSPSDKDSSAGSIQSFLDSIARSDSFGTDACWRPLNDSAMDGIGTTMDDFGSIAKSRDFVSYYWNQNCTLRWMNFAEDCNAPVGSQPSQQREPELAESELPKSYEDYVKQQNDFRQEISFLSDLFNKHKKQESQMNHDGFINPFAQSINAIVSNTSQQQQQHRDDSPSQRRISLVNHESESSAFQEVSTTIATPTRSELLIMLQDLNTDQSNKADSQSGRIDSPAFQLASSNQYFQPIEPDELAKSDLNLGDFDWTPLLQQNSKQANATTDASSTTNSTSYSRSISVSRAELEAYFTPLDHSMASLGTTTVGTCDSSAVPSATSFGDVNVLVTSATFYSSTTTTMTTSCPSRDSTAAVPATLTTNSVTSTDYFSAHNDKMSNSNCACKKSCNGHFLESACCCYPDEYHCRVGLVSPPEARMCDKSTTTELLEAVNASLGFIGNKQQQTTFTDDKMKQQAISSPLLDDLMKLFTTASTVANQQPQHHHIDDDELNVTDLVNDVLRLTVTAQQGGQLSPLNDFTNAFSTFTSTVKDNSSQVEAKHSIQPSEDIFDGPPMPYSKRKKFQNNKNMVYGQFPISSDEMQELRLLSQKQQLKPKSFEPKRNSKNSSISRPSNAMPNGTSSVDHSYFAYSHHDESQHQNNYESPDSGENNHDDGPSAEYNGYGDYHEDSAGGYYDDQAGEPNAASDYADHYMVGPDGAQYYVDTDDPGGGGGTYSPEELFAQYGTDAYAMMNSTMDDSNKNSVYPLFDLKFKSDNRTIDTIEVPKQNQKPCTFYMEGFCARGDCKFSHDLSSITCKYWQEGFCIKEEFCPFLHGYPESRKILPPVEHSKLDPNAKSFQFKIESDFDFPALAGEDDEFGLMESDSGLGPTVPGINASSESLQQYLTSNGSNSNNYRVNFQMMKSASKQPKPKFVNGSVNGHYNASRHSEQQNNQRQGTDEEWPSLNGGGLSDSMLNGDSAKNNHSQEQYGAGSSSSSSSYNEHRVNYREKVTKNNKKNKYRFSGGSDRSGSNSANTSGNNNASSSATTKYGVTLKGFL